MNEAIKLYLGDLKDKLAEAAKRNNTTLSHEIRRRLRDSLAKDGNKHDKKSDNHTGHSGSDARM